MQALTTKIDQSVMSGILRKNTQQNIARRAAEMPIRPTPENAYYRFRLLSFPPDPEFVNSAGLTYYRDMHFLPRYMHVVWKDEPSDKSPTGVRKVRYTIPCPASEYIRVNSNLTKKTCPICSAGNGALAAYTESGRHNQIAKEKWLRCKSVFEALIPVYVVSDPNNDANIGSVKVWKVNEEQYKRIVTLVNEAERSKTPIFNDEAVDLYFSYGETEKSRTNNKTKEVHTWTQNDIVKLGLTTKVYKVSGLDDLVKGLNFDATWFTIPTLDELQEFYAKHIATVVSPVNDIPNDIPEVAVSSKPSTPKLTRPTAAPKDDFSKEFSLFDTAPVETSKPTAPAAPTVDIPNATTTKPNETDLDADIDSFMQGITL